jgi:hypothetical protein
MTWMEGTFAGGAKNLTRIILRVADPAVDMIQVGNISIDAQSFSNSFEGVVRKSRGVSFSVFYCSFMTKFFKVF